MFFVVVFLVSVNDKNTATDPVIQKQIEFIVFHSVCGCFVFSYAVVKKRSRWRSTRMYILASYGLKSPSRSSSGFPFSWSCWISWTLPQKVMKQDHHLENQIQQGLFSFLTSLMPNMWQFGVETIWLLHNQPWLMIKMI